ncbi:MAG: DNA repair protein RecN [Clostridia bacterium]|nr:DNA repair protein RecN [Clostridia bacterium]
MLNKILIKNFALIDKAEIIFTKGFNVLSGETGSGKSIILDALNFVLGAKADKTYIRSGENECIVTAEFDLSNLNWARNVYEDLDFDYDSTLIISRKFTIDGKSSIKINGNTANVSMIKKFTANLVDVHGQSEHFYLLSATNQLALLDKFGSDKLLNKKAKINDILLNYKNVVREIEQLGGDENQRLIRLDILNFQINEIEKVDLKDGEEEELAVIKEKLKNQEKIVNALSSIKYSLNGEGGVCDVLAGSERESINISSYGKEYQELCDRISAVSAEIDDISGVADSLLQSFDYSEYDYNEIDSRLDDIKKIKKKYGDNYLEIVEFLENAKKEKDKLENFSVLYEKLVVNQNNLKKELYNEFIELRKLREDTAKILSKSVQVELKELGMPNSKFEIGFSSIPNFEDCNFERLGFDTIEFNFSANLGEPLKPLSFVISGGEMSRFMLSIKVQTSKHNDISTFVFDEIDAGISGIVARVVAEKLVKISKDVQVIAISHLPQIVAYADNNLLISKITDGKNTYTRVESLDYEQKIKEISRLIGSFSNNKTADEHSINIIEESNKFKAQI